MGVQTMKKDQLGIRSSKRRRIVAMDVEDYQYSSYE